jgi:GDP-L-fucose synthase
MTFWNDRRVMVTGGGGFLGRALLARLADVGATNVLAPARRDLNLLDADRVRHYLDEHRPDLIIHAAAVVGGIGANRDHPGRFFYENALMGIQLIELARRSGVAKFVCIGTVCAYPKFTPVPFREEDLWNGYPEETNAPYGLAKKMLLAQLQAYRQEYGMNGIFLLPANLYGPHDNFSPELSHVIPAMIRKFVEAGDRGEPAVELWGDGSPTREFLFVDDAAEGIVLAAEAYDAPDPVNLGTHDEISIRDLANLVAAATGFTGELQWDSTKPNGQPRRQLDTQRAYTAFGFRARTPFAEGLRRTVDWYRASRERTGHLTPAP